MGGGTIILKASFGEEEKEIILKNTFGGHGYQIFIENYYYGQVVPDLYKGWRVALQNG